MSDVQNILITVSLAAWLAVVISDFVHNKKNLLSPVIQIILACVAGVVLHFYFGYFNTAGFKGGMPVGEGWIISGLYVSTVLGIIGQHVFIQIKGLDKRGKQPKIKWMPLVKPLIISPIVFLAVLNQLEQIGAKTNASALKPMITQFILAFQNGFFWKTVIEQFEGKKSDETK
ncbi:MAG: hypothetical protein GY795_05985 [Desulfobacterales bacterium]|nr:hypothetical protein [Desulfobacterales bacterium]